MIGRVAPGGLAEVDDADRQLDVLPARRLAPGRRRRAVELAGDPDDRAGRRLVAASKATPSPSWSVTSVGSGRARRRRHLELHRLLADRDFDRGDHVAQRSGVTRPRSGAVGARAAASVSAGAAARRRGGPRGRRVAPQAARSGDGAAPDRRSRRARRLGRSRSCCPGRPRHGSVGRHGASSGSQRTLASIDFGRPAAVRDLEAELVLEGGPAAASRP